MAEGRLCAPRYQALEGPVQPSGSSDFTVSINNFVVHFFFISTSFHLFNTISTQFCHLLLYLHHISNSKVKVSRDRPRWPKGFRVG